MDTMAYPNKPINTLYLYEVFIKYYSRKNDYHEAFAWQQKRNLLADSLDAEQRKVRENTLGQLTSLESKRFEDALTLERTTREREQRESQLRLWIIILISIGTAVIISILYFYYRQRLRLHKKEANLFETERQLSEEKLRTREQEKKLLDMQLEYKKKDLADLALSLSQKQEWATELVKTIEKLESVKGHQRSREIKRIKEEVRGQVYVNEELEILQQNFDSISAEFYDKLRTLFPDITKTEKRMCSYIRLNLSNAQIAQLQNIDPESARTGRYRLKKKLNLPDGLDLETFLQKL